MRKFNNRWKITIAVSRFNLNAAKLQCYIDEVYILFNYSVIYLKAVY